ncbi:hypothetical protein [Candidatus Sororendozoicomonas aggregata]|uniref:helix-turn-helix domain-containing protein n=1 Tax=Candidatus Sororendozoicomonas aggregata TaxID=3073239 RepID=UPI002ED4908E
MTETVNDRINAVLKHTGLKKYQFALKTGISNTFMSDVTLGKQKPSCVMLCGIANSFPKVDMNWVLTGSGEMLRKETPSNEENFCSNDLTVVVRTVELALQKAKINPSPDKRANLIAAAYDLYIHSNKPENTQPLIRLIASSAGG